MAADDPTSPDLATVMTAGTVVAPPAVPLPTDDIDLGRITPRRDPSLVGANIDSGGSMLGRGVAGAVLGHVLLAALFVAYPVDSATWSGGGAGDGMDVELISSRALSVSEPTRAAVEAAASPLNVAPAAPDPSAAPEKTALLRSTMLAEPEPQSLDAATVIDTPRDVAEAPPAPVDKPPDKPQPKVETAVVVTEASDASRSAVDRDPSTAGSAARAGSDTAAAVSARAGEIDVYKRQMVEAIDRCKPRDTRGNKGTVWISYVVDPDGSVGLAYIDRSSGVRSLDALALDALRGCRFAAPSPGLPRDARFYRIPFLFK